MSWNCFTVTTYLVKRLLYLEGALPETKSKLKHFADEHGFDDLLTYL